MSTPLADKPESIYLWIVPSEHMLDQSGSWRIRKWDTTPFPEATHTARSSGAERDSIIEACAKVIEPANHPMLMSAVKVIRALKSKRHATPT